MAKRKLKEGELQALRFLATRVGVGTPTYDMLQPSTARFLLGRGLVYEKKDPVFQKYEITQEGLFEIARSGRVTVYDPVDLVNRYRRIFEALKPMLDKRSLRVVGLMEYIDPSFPHRNLENLAFLRKDDGLWMRSTFGEADILLSMACSCIRHAIEGYTHLADADEDRFLAQIEILKNKTLT